MAGDAWSLYWRRGLLDSCLTGDDPSVETTLADLWGGFAALLPRSARVLDLATGNGAVPVRLAHASSSLIIEGIDLATVQADDAVRRVAAAGSTLVVRAGTDMTRLPYANGAFDAVTSQYGFEYAPQQAAAAEAARMLAPGGRLRFLVHHAGGVLVGRNVGQVTEIDRLLAPDGIIERLVALMGAGEMTGPLLTGLETAGQKVLDTYDGRPPRISTQVFGAINQLLAGRAMSSEYRLFAAHDLADRLAAERTRMHQLANAARTDQQMAAMAACFTAADLVNVAWSPFYVGPDAHLAGWILEASRA